MTVVILEDAAADIELGGRFYEFCEAGVGDYFVEAILADLDSLVIFAGIHPVYFGFPSNAVQAISLRSLL